VSRYKETEWSRVEDLARYLELRWLNQYPLISGLALAVVLTLAGGL
jgi:hypothetical protein